MSEPVLEDENGEGDVQAASRRNPAQWLQSLATVVAPLTLLTAILGYVGWVRTRAYFSHFGLTSTLVGYTPQDYLLRSADVSFGAIFLLGLIGTFLLLLDWSTAKLLKKVERRAPWARKMLAGIGGGLAVIVLAAGAASATLAIVPSITGAAVLGLGIVMFLRFGGARGWGEGKLLNPAVALSLVLLVLAAFWAATSYAESIGTKAAEYVDQYPEELALATVYSNELIDFAGSKVVPTRVFAPDEKWHYRYSGLRVLAYSNNRWFLIPEPPSGGYRSTVTVLSDSGSIRVETSVPQ